MPSSIRTKLTAVAAIAAAALGGSVVANAATSTSTTASGAAAATQPAPPAGVQQGPTAQRDPSMGGHQANGETEKLLTGDTAAKVEAVAKAKYPGATIERVENDADTSSPYEAHMRNADGSEVIVYVNSNFEVTGTGTMGHP